MNTESVVKFLGNVPLLQRLPSSSLKRIAEVVVLKHYGRGDYVVREDQDLDGVYFILEGEAQVLESAEQENCSEFLLKRYDYFGRGISGDAHPADVVAVSELTCLLLSCDHCALLQTKSIWDSDEQFETCSLVERILHLDHLDLNIFQAITLPNAPTFGKVFGGQLVGQALAAASKTVDFLKIVHNLHSCFLRVGDLDFPIIYDVHHISNATKFATRRVEARQRGKIIYILFASFQKDNVGYIHQDSTMPVVPAPDSLLSREELHDRRLTDPRLPRDYRNKVAAEGLPAWPVDIRFCEPNSFTEQAKSPPRLRYWFRVKGKLSDEQALHRCAVAFVSDLLFACVTLNPHRKKDLTASGVSLNHSMWFHRPLRANDWLLFVMVSPTGSGSRGFTTGEMFNRKGELVVSLTQEAFLKEAATVKPTFGSKL